MVILDRFWSKVQKTDTCWNWIGSKLPTGYGTFKYDGKTMYAHRLSYEFANRMDIPEGLQIDHLCKNKSCVNPDHLEMVTPKINCQRVEPRDRNNHWSKKTTEKFKDSKYMN